MYPQEIMVGAIVNENATTATTAIALTTTPAAVVAKWRAHYPFIVQRVSLAVTTAVFNQTTSVITANMVKLTQNSTPVTTAICTLTIPNGATAGSVYYNNCTPTLIPPGCMLQFSINTALAGGTPAGAGFLGFFGSVSPENLTNETAVSAMNLVTA